MEAESYLQQAADASDDILGDSHATTLHYLEKLHDCLCKLGRDWEAEPMGARLTSSSQAGAGDSSEHLTPIYIYIYICIYIYIYMADIF